MVAEVISGAGEFSIASCSLALQQLRVAIEHLKGGKWPLSGGSISPVETLE